MNLPPSTYLRVAHTDLQAFIAQMGQTVGLPTEKAELLAEMLTANDLRGVFSHGTTQMATYARLLRDGILSWYLLFAKDTGMGVESVTVNWGIWGAVTGIAGGFAAGWVSDRFFNSRRAPSAAPPPLCLPLWPLPPLPLTRCPCACE